VQSILTRKRKKTELFRSYAEKSVTLQTEYKKRKKYEKKFDVMDGFGLVSDGFC
jgi:hypothetical protein